MTKATKVEFVKRSLLIILIAFFVVFTIFTAILVAWPLLAYLSSESFG